MLHLTTTYKALLHLQEAKHLGDLKELFEIVSEAGLWGEKISRHTTKIKKQRTDSQAEKQEQCGEVSGDSGATVFKKLSDIKKIKGPSPSRHLAPAPLPLSSPAGKIQGLVMTKKETVFALSYI